MTLFKISSLIMIYFITRAVIAAPNCETRETLKGTEKVCWIEFRKGWFSEACLANNRCGALAFFYTKPTLPPIKAVGGQNESTLVCHALKLPVTILRDEKENEQSFCVFPDGTIADANVIARKFGK